MLLAWKKFQRFDDFDLVIQRGGLRALAERLGEGEAQRDHRDQQRDFLVLRQGRAAGIVAAVMAFVVLDLVLDFVLDRVDAVNSWSSPEMNSRGTMCRGGTFRKSKPVDFNRPNR